MEKLGRGVIAVRTSANQVYIGWRRLATDPANITFNVYRGTTLLNRPQDGLGPLAFTNFTDTNTSTTSVYTVRAVVNGVEQPASEGAKVLPVPYLLLPLQKPADGVTSTGEAYSYSPNDCSVGDLDGDGEYEMIVKWDPSNSKDNSQDGITGNVYLDAYKMDGTRLWRIDLGKNIRAGAHYTQFIVYDLDSDGKAELACKTGDGTIDGTGKVIGDANADHRNTAGRILTGPEYLTVFNGMTGEAMATTAYVPGRDPIGGWGNDGAGRPETYGNRVDRFLAGVGYFDDKRPSLLMTRGYYGRSVLAAWDWRNGQLTQRWVFDSNNEGYSTYAGQGFHSLSINDVDGDGKDEVVFGSMVVDDDGKGLYTTRLGHGDALHVTNMDPDRPGQEVWACQESPSEYAGYGLRLRDAKTGEFLWGVPSTGDVGRALAADIDPAHKGYEMWGAGSGGVYNVKGEKISDATPSMNFAVWWDTDLQRELLDNNRISKWGGQTITLSGNSNNGSKATPNLSADIFGDWREEVVLRSQNNDALYIHTPTSFITNPDIRIYTLMHDPQYRVSVAWQNVGYNQPPHTSFYLGGGMSAPPVPDITVEAAANTTSSPDELDAQKHMVVYPNPSNRSFHINAEGAFSYTIFDQLGRNVEAGSGVYDASVGNHLTAGLYLLKVETSRGSKVIKVIKQ